MRARKRHGRRKERVASAIRAIAVFADAMLVASLLDGHAKNTAFTASLVVKAVSLLVESALWLPDKK